MCRGGWEHGKQGLKKAVSRFIATKNEWKKSKKLYKYVLIYKRRIYVRMDVETVLTFSDSVIFTRF